MLHGSRQFRYLIGSVFEQVDNSNDSSEQLGLDCHYGKGATRGEVRAHRPRELRKCLNLKLMAYAFNSCLPRSRPVPSGHVLKECQVVLCDNLVKPDQSGHAALVAQRAGLRLGQFRRLHFTQCEWIRQNEVRGLETARHDRQGVAEH